MTLQLHLNDLTLFYFNIILNFDSQPGDFSNVANWLAHVPQSVPPNPTGLESSGASSTAVDSALFRQDPNILICTAEDANSSFRDGNHDFSPYNNHLLADSVRSYFLFLTAPNV